MGWKKMEMRHWVYVLVRDETNYYVGVAPSQTISRVLSGLNAHWTVLCLLPARAKDESIFLQADIADRILDNKFMCNTVSGSDRYRLPERASV